MGRAEGLNGNAMGPLEGGALREEGRGWGAAGALASWRRAEPAPARARNLRRRKMTLLRLLEAHLCAARLCVECLRVSCGVVYHGVWFASMLLSGCRLSVMLYRTGRSAPSCSHHVASGSALTLTQVWLSGRVNTWLKRGVNTD